ncbi:CRISPR-associated protein [Moorella thermoacetica]|uniref:CRISPR-associated protein n=1 Tax=Neomoorella thermoacetica TaxID=1525 RepID=A0A1J5NJ37_NEOTH|nr:CRISPR-associated protein [Moorella thermoacetica]
MQSVSTLYERLKADLSDCGTAAGVMVSQKLSPFESGFDVQPPTYSTGEDGRGGRQTPTRHFAVRRIPEKGMALTVLMDSIPSQANRLEEIMRNRVKDLDLPVVGVRVGVTGYLITQYDAPHRIYDGYFKFSKLDGQPFFASPIGQEILSADTFYATPLYRWSPNTLLFGGWASHADETVMQIAGSEGRFQRAQAKLERAMEATIIGVVSSLPERELDPIRGPEIIKALKQLFTAGRTQSRYDPLNASAPKGKEPSKEKLSQLGLGHILPTIEEDSGYVSVEEILYQAVLKFASLRKLYFPPGSGGQVPYAHERDVAGRVVLASLGLYLLALYLSQGTLKLRSRATLIPRDGAARAEYLAGPGQREDFVLDPGLMKELYECAKEDAQKYDLTFTKECLLLELDEKELKEKTNFVFKVPVAPSYIYEICPQLAGGTPRE